MSKLINLIGEVLEVFPEQRISSIFKKREVIIKTDEHTPQTFKIECHQHNCSLLDNIGIGNKIEVDVELKGSVWINPNTNKTSYFMSLKVWKLKKLNNTSNPVKEEYWKAEDLIDDLPF